MKSEMINMKDKIEKLGRIVIDKSNTHVAIASQCTVWQKVNVKTDEQVLVTLNEEMHIDLTPSDIDRTHRIGQKKILSRKPRAVFIKFAIIQEKYFF